VTDIGLFDAIYSARALRRLRPDPVPDVVGRCADCKGSDGLGLRRRELQYEHVQYVMRAHPLASH